MDRQTKKPRNTKQTLTASGSSGFGLVEAVVGAAIIASTLLGVVAAAQLAFRATKEANLKLRALFLAEEGLEAARILRDASFSKNISPLVLGTDYYLNFSGGNWQLTTTAPPLTDDVFDRRIRLAAVSRSSSDDIVVSGGTLDPNTKEVTVSLNWTNRGQSANIAFSTYLANLFNN